MAQRAPHAALIAGASEDQQLTQHRTPGAPARAGLWHPGPARGSPAAPALRRVAGAPAAGPPSPQRRLPRLPLAPQRAARAPPTTRPPPSDANGISYALQNCEKANRARRFAWRPAPLALCYQTSMTCGRFSLGRNKQLFYRSAQSRACAATSRHTAQCRARFQEQYAC